MHNHTISLIQPNVGLIDKREINNAKNHLDKLITISKKCIQQGSNLVVWPESALPFQNIQNKTILNKITNSLLSHDNVHILTGNIIKFSKFLF